MPGSRKVDVYKIEESENEMKAFFYTSQWNVKKDGFIHNNPVWLQDFGKAVGKKDVEQCLQGAKYVHLDNV